MKRHGLALAAMAMLLSGCASPDRAELAASVDCSEQARFKLALDARPVPSACAVVAPDEAYNLGAMIREDRDIVRTLRIRLRNDPPGTDRETVRLRQQLIRAERDLPELEALARMEGWLPPASLPDTN